jgi:hypothetical protein
VKKCLFKCRLCHRRPQRPPWDICAQCRAKAVGKGARNQSRREDRKAAEAVKSIPRGALPDLRQLIAEVDRASDKALKAAIRALSIAASVKANVDAKPPSA